MRIYKDCFEMIQEVDRDLAVGGLTVPVKHYQNAKLEGDDRITKELIGVSFLISKPLEERDTMLRFIFKDEYDKISKYCEQEFKDRVSKEELNPGNSYKVRLDLWQGFMSKTDGEKFDYTYSDRICRDGMDQVVCCIEALKEDIHSRRAMVMIFDGDLDGPNMKGAETRIPCSISYQFLVRNNRVYCIYYIRSNDYFKHFGIDIYLAAEMIKYITEELKSTYPDIKTGSLTYFAGSLHAYNEDLKNWVIY
jgi:thymidylate synthase